MESGEDTQDSVTVEEIAEYLGIGSIDARRLRHILIETVVTPENSALEIEKHHVLEQHVMFRGYKMAWLLLYNNCEVTVVEGWEGGRTILDILPLPIN